MIRSHIDLLITQLREAGRRGQKVVNIRNWISYATFDIIGKLGRALDSCSFQAINLTKSRRCWVRRVI